MCDASLPDVKVEVTNVTVLMLVRLLLVLLHISLVGEELVAAFHVALHAIVVFRHNGGKMLM
jgi:hypothetical protein